MNAIRPQVRTRDSVSASVDPPMAPEDGGATVRDMHPAERDQEPGATATGSTEEGQTLISDGLQAGDRIVVDGQYKLQPGSKISITKDLDAGKDESPDPAK